VGKISEKRRRKVRKRVQACEVDHHYDAKTDQPRFVDFLSWRGGRCDKDNAKEKASEDKSKYQCIGFVSYPKDHIAPLGNVFIVIDLFKESHLLILHELLASFCGNL